MAPTNYKAEFDVMQEKLKPLGFSIALPPNCTYHSKLSPALFECDTWSDRKILVTLDQLKYLPLPLYNPDIPLFYRILCAPEFSRALYQIGGDVIRIGYQYARRAAGLETSYKNYLNPKFPTDAFNTSDYTVENFFKHYSVGVMRTDKSKWAVRLNRNIKDFPNEEDRIMCDVDFYSKSNFTCRKSHDTTWLNCPVILTGPYISGLDANGEVVPLPADYPAYCPWEFRLTAKEQPKVKKAARKIAADQVAGELTSSSRGKKRASKEDNSSSKRAKSSLRSSADDDSYALSVSDFRRIFSQCFDNGTTILRDHPEVNEALECLSKVCHGSSADKAVVHNSSRLLPAELIFSLHNVVARASHSTVVDYERRVNGMKRKINKLQTDNVAKDAEIKQLKEAHSSCAIDLNRLRKSKEKIDNRYQALGQNWEILVQNSENECLRRELAGIKRVCDDHKIDPNQYVFGEIAADKDYLPFYDSENDEDDSDDERTDSNDNQEGSENDNQDAGEDNDQDAGEDDVEPEDSHQEDTGEDGEDGSDEEETQDKDGEETQEDNDVDMDGTK